MQPGIRGANFFPMATGDTLMAEKPTYNELERKIKRLEIEALEFLHRERELNADRKLVDYSHLKRTISLMKINEELNREIEEIKCIDKERLERETPQLLI